MTAKPHLPTELALLALLATIWGGSYPLLKIAVTEIPPVSLIAMRVTGAALLLLLVLALRGEHLPTDARTWRMLLVQAIFNSIAAWTILAWGQQYVDAGLASVLNSTSPIFVLLFTAFITRHETLTSRKLAGVALGISGVVLIVGVDALQGLGREIAAQLACLASAAFYGAAAIYGKRLGHISSLATATGAMLWSSLTLIPAALVIEGPWTQTPSARALAATAALAILSTGIGLLIYFRLIRTIGSMGAASQAYLRAGIGVALGLVFLGETLSPVRGAGLVLAILGVALINWPAAEPSRRAAPPAAMPYSGRKI